MRKIKLLQTLSIGLIGGGIIASVPLVITACGHVDQTITGNKKINGFYGDSGAHQYISSANTVTGWDVALKNGSPLPDQITIDNGGTLTYTTLLPAGNYKLIITCQATGLNDGSLSVDLIIAKANHSILGEFEPSGTEYVANAGTNYTYTTDRGSVGNTWSIEPLDNSIDNLASGVVKIDASTGVLTWTDGIKVGQWPFRIQCSNLNYDTAFKTIELKIASS